MLPLRTPRIPIHHLLHQIRTHTTRIPYHLRRYLQRPLQHPLSRIHRLRKQTPPYLVVCPVRRASRYGLHRATVPDEPRQEVRRAGFHDETPAGEDEADFGRREGDSDVHGECHGYADADGGWGWGVRLVYSLGYGCRGQVLLSMR